MLFIRKFIQWILYSIAYNFHYQILKGVKDLKYNNTVDNGSGWYYEYIKGNSINRKVTSCIIPSGVYDQRNSKGFYDLHTIVGFISMDKLLFIWHKLLLLVSERIKRSTSVGLVLLMTMVSRMENISTQAKKESLLHIARTYRLKRMVLRNLSKVLLFIVS